MDPAHDPNPLLHRLHSAVLASGALAWGLGRGWPAALAFLGPGLVGLLYLWLLPWRLKRPKAAGAAAGLGFLLLMGAAARAMIMCFPGEGVPAGTGLLIHGVTLMAVAIRQGIVARTGS